MLTPRQLEIADHLLIGLDYSKVPARMGITDAELRAELRDMRRRVSVDGHQALLGRLREMRRNPAAAMVEQCRVTPREWWSV